MDGPRDYHTECSESEEGRYDATHMWIQKVIDMYQHTKQTHRCRQHELKVLKGKRRRGGMN